MFIHETHLPQRFSSACYSSSTQFEREIEKIFLPAWHFIGTASQLPREGDYFTTTLLGRPLLCWRQDGVIRTFLNICCHRFCTLTSQPRGRFDQRMTCQYHGWEFDEDGHACRIPDARSFRPLAKGQLGLRQFRTERVGQLVFVALQEPSASLEDYLGDRVYGLCQEWFSDLHQPTGNFDAQLDCNWKVVVENVLESYHIDTVHPTTFKTFAPAENCEHKFHEYGDEFFMDYATWGYRNRDEWLISKLVGVEPAYSWRHLLRYPNTLIARSSLVSYVQSVVPISPSSCLNVFRAFHYTGGKKGIRSRLADQLMRRFARKFIGKVLNEDAAIYPHVQTGAASAVRPGEGLVSIREERIFPFQEFVLKATQESS